MERANVSIRVAPPLPRQSAAQRTVAWLRADGSPILIYCCTRLVIYAVAGIDALLTRRSVPAELSLFDGQWYLKLASHSYPATAVPGKSTLGFLPLYPLAIQGLSNALDTSLLVAALIISFAGGLIAALLVQRLATYWWGEDTARRAVLAFCLFPGSVVFSMAYSEGLTLPLVLGCLLALRSDRWLLAGATAALASAVEPAALILFPVCLAVSARQIRTAGWRDRQARLSLVAPLLAPSGLGVFALYLWVRTGTPFASYQPVARKLFAHPSTLWSHLLNPSLWNGLLGTVFLVCALVALARVRHELTPGVMLWTCGVGVLTLWSVMSLTNARMLLIAFPAVIVWARTLTGRRYHLFLGAEAAVFLLATGLTL